MTTLDLTKAHFLISAAKLSQLPSDEGAEVAFVGRSNVGKSSTINTITGCRKLAHTSKTPGRTQLINFFEVTPQCRIVDLPGYGYAKVPQEVKQRWQRTLSEFLTKRACLRGLFVIMDIRHPLMETDMLMLEMAAQTELPVHLILNKADKLSKGAATQVQHRVTKELHDFPTPLTLQLFSATTGLGLDQARRQLTTWLTS